MAAYPPEVTLSPDGRVRIELHRDEDERSGPWITVQLIDAQTGEMLVSETRREGGSAFRFTRPGIVAVTMTDAAGESREVEIDAAARRFRAYRSEVFEPLALLPSRLGRTGAQATTLARSPVRGFAAGLVAAGGVITSLAFVLCGGWMALAADTAKDRWIGVAGVVFFGACLVSSLADWRRRNSG